MTSTLPADQLGGGVLAALRVRYAAALDRTPGLVYALHFDPPREVRNAGPEYAGWIRRIDADWSARSFWPVAHYVGWTLAAGALLDIRSHGPAWSYTIAEQSPGTPGDEWLLKLEGACPACGQLYAADLDPRPPDVLAAASRLRALIAGSE